MPFLETSTGIRIHYETAGKGPPLVLIHGWAMAGHVWHNLHGLAENYRLVIPDLRGHGHSEAPEAGYSFELFAQDLRDLLCALDLRSTTIIAWSMGVQVALQAYPLVADRLAAFIFIAGTPKFTSADDYPAGLAPSETRGLGLLLKRDHRKAVHEFIRGMFSEEELLQERFARMSGEEVTGILPAVHAASASLQALADADLRGVLPSIEIPVLLVHGSADSICPVSASHFMAQQLPDARLAIIDGAGHAPFLTRPAELSALVNKFINGIYADD